MTQERDGRVRPRTPPKTENNSLALARQEGQVEGAQLNPADLYALQGMVGNTAVGQLGQIQRAPQNGAMLENVSNAAFDSILGRGQAIAPPQQSIQRAPEDKHNEANNLGLDLTTVTQPSTQGGISGSNAVPEVPSLNLEGVAYASQFTKLDEAKGDDRKNAADRAQQQFLRENAEKTNRKADKAKYKEAKKFVKYYSKHDDKRLKRLFDNPQMKQEAKEAFIQNLAEAHVLKSKGYTKKPGDDPSAKDHLKTGGNLGTKAGPLGSLVASGASAAQSTIGSVEEFMGATQGLGKVVSPVTGSIKVLTDFAAGEYKGQYLDLLMDFGSNILQLGQRLGEIAQFLVEVSTGAISNVPLPIIGVVASGIQLAQHARNLVRHGMRLIHTIRNLLAAKKAGDKALKTSLKALAFKSFQQSSEDILGMLSSSLSAVGSILAVLPADGFGGIPALGLSLIIAGSGLKGITAGTGFLFDNYRAYKSQKSEKHYLQGREGAEKGVLRHNFKYAAQTIINYARDGNEIALDELTHYGIEKEQLERKENKQLREKILKKIKETEDPKTTLQTLQEGAKTVKSGISSGGSFIASNIGGAALRPLRALNTANKEQDLGITSTNHALKYLVKRDKNLKQREQHISLVSEGRRDEMEMQFGSQLGSEGDPHISGPMSKEQSLRATNRNRKEDE